MIEEPLLFQWNHKGMDLEDTGHSKMALCDNAVMRWQTMSREDPLLLQHVPLGRLGMTGVTSTWPNPLCSVIDQFSSLWVITSQSIWLLENYDNDTCIVSVTAEMLFCHMLKVLVIWVHYIHDRILSNNAVTEKKDSQNGSPRRVVWSSVTQLSMELHFGATLQGRPVSKQKNR